MSNVVRFILCEGKTDAILLSYYLESTRGWVHDKKPRLFKLKSSGNDNFYIGHYKNEDKELSVCAVGGKDNFINFYRDHIEGYIKASENPDLNYKLAIVVDRDDRTTEEIKTYFSDNLKPCINNITNDTWTKNTFHDKFDIETTVDTLCIIIPNDRQGALENLLMDALSEDTYKKNLIDKSKFFVDLVTPEATKIISTERLKLKTKFGVSLAVLYPEKTFSLIDEQLKCIPWEKSSILADTFEELLEI